MLINTYRGKKTGHDTDILIWHPEEGKEHGLLTKLVQKLESYVCLNRLKIF